jgi:hypothetical protein
MNAHTHHPLVAAVSAGTAESPVSPEQAVCVSVSQQNGHVWLLIAACGDFNLAVG